MTHREWLERADLKFNIGGRKENTLVWIANDQTYRPAHGDTGLRLEPKHLRGNVFPALYKALKADVERINEKLLGQEPRAGTDTELWQKTMRALCERRQWLRLFIQHGGLSTVVAERDVAEKRVNWESNLKLRKVQAQSDDAQVQLLGEAIGRGAYALKPERLVLDVMKLMRANQTTSAPTPVIPPSPDSPTRREKGDWARALESRS